MRNVIAVLMPAVVLTACLPSPRLARIHITTEHDKFTERDRIRLDPMSVSWDSDHVVYLTALWGEIPPDAVQVTFQLARADCAPPAQSNSPLLAVIDGERGTLGTLDAKEGGVRLDIGRVPFCQWLLSLDLPRATLERLVRAKVVELKVDTDEFTLLPVHVSGLRKFLATLPRAERQGERI